LPPEIGGEKRRVQPARGRSELGRRRARLLFRRHFAGIHLVHNADPRAQFLRGGKVQRQLVEREVTLVFAVAVAAVAMLLEERRHRLGEATGREVRRGGGANGSGQKDRKSEAKAHGGT